MRICDILKFFDRIEVLIVRKQNYTYNHDMRCLKLKTRLLYLEPNR